MNKKLLSFWINNAKNIHWFNFPKQIINFKNDYFKWYEDGTTNVAFNCLENKNFDSSKKIAIIYCNKDKKISSYTYSEISILVSKLAHYLYKRINSKRISIKVLIHGSASIETSLCMLACAKLGFEHCVVFENSSSDALLIRLQLFKPDLIITRSDIKQYNRDLKPLLKDDAIKKIKIIHFAEQNELHPIKDKINLDKLHNYNKLYINYKVIKSNHKLFTLFTSGSTGAPKGIIHSSGGYLSYIKYTCISQFGLNNNSTILTASDAGWINGHTYALYGPLSCGATTFIIESPLLILDEKFLKKIINKYKITILYLPVTLIRMMKVFFKKNIINTPPLKTIGSMGEPLAPSTANWLANYFSLKNKAIINTYFQTETGGIICSAKYTDSPKLVPHGSVGKPINYLEVKIQPKKYFNEFIIKNQWPGCMIDIVNGKKEWSKYWTEEKYFRMFDIASKDEMLNYYISGRTDDVINIRGHRIGAGEIESIILKHTKVNEASAISVEDSLEGNVIVLFLGINKNKNIIEKKLINKVLNSYFGSYAIPQNIYMIRELPKTRSGKILRRILRNLYKNPNDNNIGDISTIINKDSLIDIRQAIINPNNQKTL